jgi:hypothetical protein
VRARAAQSADSPGLLSKMMSAITQLGLDVYRRARARSSGAFCASFVCSRIKSAPLSFSALTRCCLRCFSAPAARPQR